MRWLDILPPSCMCSHPASTLSIDRCQATLPTSSPAATPDEWVTQFQETLAYFAGFFVTEHMALEATEHPEGLLSAASLEEAWWGIQRDLCDQMEAKAAQLTSPAHFIQVREGVSE